MRVFAKAQEAQASKEMVEEIQGYFVDKLNSLCMKFGDAHLFESVEWDRDEGLHGGGVRYESRDERVFNRASVNVSQVHYDDNEAKKLSSATAISTIIHPLNPYAPSMHMHISWTQLRDNRGYFRLMADLNPSIENPLFKEKFEKALAFVLKEKYEEAKKAGEDYFYIPILDRTRGVSHFYLENYYSGDFNQDLWFAKTFTEVVIDTYIAIVDEALTAYLTYTEEEKKIQLAYHTLYFLQVLTLDRGTTSGLLVHNQNDVGIMGSIPKCIDKVLLSSWITKMPTPQDRLLRNLVEVLPDTLLVESQTKIKLANVVRAHYLKHPEALNMQASIEIIPPTVKNHA